MHRSVMWKAISAVGAVALVAGVACLAGGSEDMASALFVAGAIEITAGLGLLAAAALRRKLAHNK